MSVHKLITKDFRNIIDGNIEFDANFNFIIGNNGSGKSSLLEAIFFVGHGKSFRTTKTENLAKYNSSSFVVSLKDESNIQLGVSRNIKLGQTTIRLNGDNLTRLSDLAKNIAVQIVTPESFKLFFGGPKERRKFIDLGLFHVEHEFSVLWRDFSRVLKQRNACLKNKNYGTTLEYWTSKFVEYSESVSDLRYKYFESFKNELDNWITLLLPDFINKLDVTYFKGWSNKNSLEDLLKNNYQREIFCGYSLYGAHKFDIKFTYNQVVIENQLSRGQQKLFLLALTFAQAKLIERVNRVKPILLIDDVGAELDVNSRCVLFTAIEKLNCQVIITAIDKVVLKPLVPSNNSYKMFHVEHGKTSEMSE